jgi:UDP-glucose 4-epimerase
MGREIRRADSRTYSALLSHEHPSIMTRVLVTGATGFLGSHLCRAVLDSGAQVCAIRRSESSVCLPGVQVYTGDLRNLEQTRTLLHSIRPDYVFHLAAVTSASRDLSLVLPTFQSNLITTINLLTVVAQIGCQRVVLAGSLEEPLAGDVPSSPYAVSKWSATAYARMFWQLYKTPVTVARIFMVYGPAQRDVKKLIPFTILSLLRGIPPQISSGSRLVDWVYIQDVISGLLALGRAPAVEGKTVDLGTGVLTSVREIVERLVQIVNPKISPQFGSVPERPGEEVRSANVAETAMLLGWKPTVSLDWGLRQTTEFYREHFADYPQ